MEWKTERTEDEEKEGRKEGKHHTAENEEGYT